MALSGAQNLWRGMGLSSDTKIMGIAAVRAIARMRFRVWGHAFDNGRVARCLTTRENDRIHLRALQACWDSFRPSRQGTYRTIRTR